MLQIGFVPQKHHFDCFFAVFLNLTDPTGESVEGAAVCYVINEENAEGVFVVGIGHGLKLLLSRSIPELNLDQLVFDLDVLGEKVDPDGGSSFLLELILCVSGYYIGLSYPRVPYDYYFQYIINLRLFQFHSNNILSNI